MKPKALILTGYGINAEKELKWAFDLAGAEGTIVHLEDLIENKKMINDYPLFKAWKHARNGIKKYKQLR